MSKFNWVRYAVELLDMHEQTREVLPIAKRHLDQLEAKAQELDRREKGVAVSWMHRFPNCGKCDSPVDGKSNNYCGGCGTKLIWESEGE